MKALLFDACDILYHRPQYEKKLDIFFGPDRARLQKENDRDFRELHTRAAKGNLSLHQLYDGILKLYDWPVERAREGQIFLNDAMAEVEFFDGVCSCLHQLRADSFKLAIVTNSFQSSETKLSWFAKARIEHVWDAFVCSSETGLFKPEPEIYLETLKQLKTLPRDAAFVGHAANELEGAKAVGLTTIAFNRDNDQIQADYVIDHFSELVGLANSLREDVC